MSNKLWIVWVDHEKEIEKRLTDLGDLMVNTSTGRVPIRDVATLSSCVVKDRYSGDAFCDKVKEFLAEQSFGEPDLVLVDMFFGSEKGGKGYWSGVDRARALKAALAPVPVGVYTRDPNIRARDVARLSVEGFGAILSDLQTLILNERSQGYEVPPDEWLTLFGRSRQTKELRKKSGPGFFDLVLNCDIQWEGEEEFSTTRQFRRAAEVLSYLLTRELQPRRLFLRKMSGGFSGSGLVQVRTDVGPAPFLLKLDERVEKIRREISGYRDIKARLRHDCYLAPGGFETLLEDMWGGVMLPFEERKLPLLFCKGLEVEQLAHFFTRLWAECLDNLYGEDFGSRELDVSGICGSIGKELRARGQGVEKYWSYWRGDAVGTGAEIDGVVDMVVRDLEAIQVSGTRIVSTACDKVHGDLNCRNILVDPVRLEFLLIDFPAVGRSTICTDFVKVECEYVLIMLGFHDGADIDLRSLDEWTAIVRETSRRFLDCDWQEEKAVIGAIRARYKRLVPASHSHESAYYIKLMERISKYLAYPDVKDVKKLLGMAWIGELASSLKESLGKR